MGATRVIARFVSVLDIMMILLGSLMIMLLHADLRRTRDRVNSEDTRNGPGTLAQMADLGFIYLYAGWEGEQNGRCYLLTPDGKIGREVSTSRPDDLQEIIKTRRQKNQVVLLLFSKDGWYSAWDQNKLDQLEKIWEVPVVPVYNAQLLERKK